MLYNIHMGNKIGYDFDGVVSEGMLPKDGVVITNRQKDHPVNLPKGYENTQVYYNPKSGNPMEAAMYKSQMANKLGLNTFYDDDPTVAKIMKSQNPGMNIFLVKGKESTLMK